MNPAYQGVFPFISLPVVLKSKSRWYIKKFGRVDVKTNICHYDDYFLS